VTRHLHRCKRQIWRQATIHQWTNSILLLHNNMLCSLIRRLMKGEMIQTDTIEIILVKKKKKKKKKNQTCSPAFYHKYRSHAKGQCQATMNITHNPVPELELQHQLPHHDTVAGIVVDYYCHYFPLPTAMYGYY
jgi:hypothetical protein